MFPVVLRSTRLHGLSLIRTGGFLFILLVFALFMHSGCTSGSRLTGEDTVSPWQVFLDEGDSLILPLEAIGGTVGVYVTDMNGSVIYSHDESRQMLPASLQKLAVASEAMYRLPESYRWRTHVYGTGPLDENGVLHGDLVIVGGWDPSLSGPKPYHDWPWVHLRAWSEILFEEGLTHIEGDIVGVGDAFTPESWEATDYHYAFAPVVSQLTWNDGLISASYFALQSGNAPSLTDYLLELYPERRWWSTDHTRFRIPTNQTNVSSYVNNYFDHWILPGTTAGLSDSNEMVRRSYPVPDPRLLTCDALRQSLRSFGIEGGDSSRSTTEIPPQYTEYPAVGLIHQSAPLDSILDPMLSASSNLWAEMISVTVQVEQEQRYRDRVSWQESLEEMGISLDGVAAVDAAGLARRNHMSPENIAELLRLSYDQWGSRWLDLLPGPGEPNSTLESRLTDLEGRLLAKTGTLTHASCMAGYILNDGEPQATFVIMINNAPHRNRSLRADINRYVRSLVRYIDSQTGVSADYAVSRF